MKISLLLTTLIIAAAVSHGVRNHRQLEAADAAYRQALQHAGALQDSPNPSGKPQPARTRSDDDPKILAAELTAFIRNLYTPGYNGDRRQLMLDWQRRLSSVKPARMEEIIREIETTADIGHDDVRQDLLHLLLQSLAENHPRAALELVSGDSPLLQGHRLSDAVALSLLRLMEMDPAAAIDWYRGHRSIVPGQAGDWVTDRLVCGVSLMDPGLAFSLIEKFGLSDVERGVGMIAGSARTAAQRDAVLAAFREYAGAIADPEQHGLLVREAVSTLVMNARFEGIDSGLRWVETAGFTADELEDHFSRSFPVLTSEETGKWLDWMVRNLSAKETVTSTISEMVHGWAQYDYQAAGDWLAAVPEGPAKTAAAASYASALGPYQPETAVQWLETLPPDNRHKHTLQAIHRGFLKSDPAAAADFAAEYGIE